MKRAESKEVGRLIASECLSVRVRRLGRVITRIYDAALAPHGVSTAQLNLLAAIAVGDGARPGDLTRLLEVEKSTLSRDLKRMDQLGWIRSDAALPGRGRFVTLTPAGSRLLIEVREAWEKAQAAAQAELGRTPFAQLRKALPSPLTARGPARAHPMTSAPGERSAALSAATSASAGRAAPRRRSRARRRGGTGP